MTIEITIKRYRRHYDGDPVYFMDTVYIDASKLGYWKEKCRTSSYMSLVSANPIGRPWQSLL